MTARFELEPQGDHEYVVRLCDDGEEAESWIRVTPDVLDRLGVDEHGEEGLVLRTIAFLTRHQNVADFPSMVELEDVLAGYPDYAEAVAHPEDAG